MRMCLLGGGSACNRLLSDVFQQSAGLNVGVTCPVMFGVPAGMLECTLWLSIVCCYMYQSECWSGHVRSLCTFQLGYMTPHGLKLIMVITFVSPTDAFSVGPWSTLKGLQDAELQRLAKALPNSVLQSKATSTTRK